MDLANLSTKRQWIADLARRKPGEVLFSLHHVIDLEWMQEAYALTRKDGATGIDGVTAEQYEANLEANLSDLLERIKSGRYRRCGEPTSRKRMARNGRSAFRPSKTRWRSGRSRWFWKLFMNRTFGPARTAFGRNGRRTRRYARCTARPPGTGSIGCWTLTYASTSIPFPTISSAPSSTSE